MHPSSTNNHVFVDFENVCEIDPDILEKETSTFTLLLGARPNETESRAGRETLAPCLVGAVGSSSFQNALDFTLAYYLGKAVTADPNGFFHVVSKDSGFDINQFFDDAPGP